MFSQGRKMLEALNLQVPSIAKSTEAGVSTTAKRKHQPNNDDMSVSSFNSIELKALNPEWVKEMQLNKKDKTQKLVQYSSSPTTLPVIQIHQPIQKSVCAAEKVKVWLFQNDSTTVLHGNESCPGKQKSNAGKISDSFESEKFLDPSDAASGAAPPATAINSEHQQIDTDTADKFMFDENENNLFLDFLSPSADRATTSHQTVINVRKQKKVDDATPESSVGLLRGTSTHEEKEIQSVTSESRARKNLFPNQTNQVHDKSTLQEEINEIIESGIVVEDDEVLVMPLDEPVNEVLVLSRENVDKNKRAKSSTGTPLTRKRQQNPSQSKAALSKLAFNSGIAHVSLRGKQKAARAVRPGCSAACKKNCKGNISEEARYQHFQKYWGLKDKILQWLHLAKLVKVSKVDDSKRRKKPGEGDDPYKKNSYEYKLINGNGDKVIVCQKMFCDTFDISISVVKNAFKKNSPDKRGKHDKRRKVSQALVQSVKTHIKSFPMVESHYCRESTQRRYLDERLSVAKMHRLYVMVHNPSDSDTASLRQYRDIFNTHFNLGFYKPKKDQCFICNEWSSLSAEEKLLDPVKGEEYVNHIQRKVLSREAKTKDKLESRQPDSKTRTVCFDLQKVCFLPKTEIGDLFYKSKIACYNFTMFAMTSRKGHCYVWDQTIAGRGADEMTSFVFDFVGKKAEEGVVVINFWSDGCGAQNRNQFLYTMYYLASMKYKLKIVHRYLEKGHTQMEADSVHARIENKIRHEDVYTPKQWYGHIRTAKAKRPQYEVLEVTQDKIFSFRALSEGFFNWGKVPVSKVKEIIFHSSKPGLVTYKCDLNEEATEFRILKTKPGRPVNWESHQPKQAYSGPLPMKDSLQKSLKWMLNKGYIPACHVVTFQGLIGIQPAENAEAGSEDGNEDEEPQEVTPTAAQMERVYDRPEESDEDGSEIIDGALEEQNDSEGWQSDFQQSSDSDSE